LHPSPIIRDANPQDVEAIVELERLAFSQPWSAEAFAHELSLPFSRTIVAASTSAPDLRRAPVGFTNPRGSAGARNSPRETGQSLIGFLCRWLVADECHILNIAVHPGSRRAGIGTRLMGEAIAEAIVKKAAIITLEVRRSNIAARGLYRNLRFEERRVRKNYYSPGEDAIVMERQLSGATY
jgi:ribosomal-protein-alanine N-acetyltransferase